MIPVLEGGGINALGVGGSTRGPRSGAGTGSGDSFPEILGAQGQPGLPGDGEQLPAEAASAGGNVPLPGGKPLPPAVAEPALDAGAALADLELVAFAPQGLPVPAESPRGAAPALPQIAAAGVTAPAGTPAPGATPPPTALPGVTAPAPAPALDGEFTPAVRPQLTGELARANQRSQATPVPAGPQALLVATPEAAAARPAGAAAASPVTFVADEVDRGRLVPPGPAAAQTVRGTGVALDGQPRRTPDVALAIPGDGKPVRATPEPQATGPRVPAALEVANANMRPQAIVDDAPVVRLAEATAPPPGAEPARPAAAAAPVPTALVSPLAVATTDSVVPPGARTDVTGVIVAQPGEQAWNTEVAGRLSLMLRNGTPEANLQLNPPELGRMEVRITTEGDQARILFTVQGAETREVIEQALPRLRDMLEQGGLSLSRFDVADQSAGGRDSDGDVDSGGSNADVPGEEIAEGVVAQTVRSTPTDSLVDYYV
ncbi:MAG: flagellar hook-length control protein FliK [Halioglobus sp.]|nr:flagellar hook-length control protein FliK [Halioglobus sp.]